MSEPIEMYFNDFIKLNRGFDLPESNIVAGKYPIAASTSIKDYHKDFKVKAPCVTTGRSGSLGSILFINQDCWPLNTTLYVKDFKGNNPKYVYYFLQTMKLESFNCGAGVPTLNQNHLHKVKVKIHKKDEQHRIASILSAYDDLIENNNSRIALLEQMAEQIYKEWFVRMRFPGYQNTEFEKGVPKGWVVKSIKNIAQINKQNINSNSTTSEIHYIDISSVSKGKIENITSYSRNDAPCRAKRIVLHGDTIFSTVRPENRAFAFILNPDKNTVVSTGFAVLSPILMVFSEFLYLTISNETFIDEMSIKAKGAAYPQVGFDDISNHCFISPEEGSVLFEKFHSIINPLFLEKSNLQLQTQTLKQTRDLLLPRLISGKLKVKELNNPILLDETQARSANNPVLQDTTRAGSANNPVLQDGDKATINPKGFSHDKK